MCRRYVDGGEGPKRVCGGSLESCRVSCRESIEGMLRSCRESVYGAKNLQRVSPVALRPLLLTCLRPRRLNGAVEGVEVVEGLQRVCNALWKASRRSVGG